MPRSDRIRELINSVASGEVDLDSAVKSVIQKHPARDHGGNTEVVHCTNRGQCDYEVIGKLDSSKSTCPKCGAGLVSVKEETLGNPESENLAVRSTAQVVIKSSDRDVVQQYTLSFLRPGDRFIFLRTLPEGAKPDIEYTIIPAKRGLVTFTDEFNKVYTMTLSRGLLCEVKLLSGESPDPHRRFFLGDKFKCRSTGRCGVVVGIKNSGYVVRYTDDAGKKKWVSGINLRLIDKDKTTNSYIQAPVNGDGAWVVSFGDYKKECKSHISAMRVLGNENRPAFNRYSKAIVTRVGEVDEEEIRVLIKLDPKVWGRKDNLLKHGFIRKEEEYGQVREHYSI